jgi:hypothetical protein
LNDCVHRTPPDYIGNRRAHRASRNEKTPFMVGAAIPAMKNELKL